MDLPLAAKSRNFHRRCPGATYSTRSACSAKLDVDRLTMCGKNHMQLPMDSLEGSIVSMSPKTRICKWRTEHLQSKIFCKLLNLGPVMVVNALFRRFNPSSRSLKQFVANAASSRMLKLARSWKSLISACCRCCGARVEPLLPYIYSVQGLFGLAIP